VNPALGNNLVFDSRGTGTILANDLFTSMQKSKAIKSGIVELTCPHMLYQYLS
jgi:glycosyltransferase A (GT-A) superfamily protein (DUF2064 family)